MQYIAALDYQHLDNGMFLSSLARSISQQSDDVRPVILHTDSAYTERIIQTGVMREDACIHSLKDLNHRLVALLADEGISAIGINGHQRKLIILNEDGLHLDHTFWQQLPARPALLLSTLVWDQQTASPVPIELPRLATFLKKELGVASLFAFSASNKDEIPVLEQPLKLDWQNLPDGFAESYLPAEFRNFNKQLRLATAQNFHHVPSPEQTILIK